MSRSTPQASAVGPTMGLILGGVMILCVALLSLYSVIRTYLEMAKAPAPPSAEVALAGGTAGLAPAKPMMAKANAASPGPLPRQAARQTPPAAAPAAQATALPATPEAPKGPWAVATPPTWLATVDPGATFVAAPFAAPHSNIDLGSQPEDIALDVPLPRPRPGRAR